MVELEYHNNIHAVAHDTEVTSEIVQHSDTDGRIEVNTSIHQLRLM